MDDGEQYPKVGIIMKKQDNEDNTTVGSWTILHFI